VSKKLFSSCSSHPARRSEPRRTVKVARNGVVTENERKSVRFSLEDTPHRWHLLAEIMPPMKTVFSGFFEEVSFLGCKIRNGQRHFFSPDTRFAPSSRDAKSFSLVERPIEPRVTRPSHRPIYCEHKHLELSRSTMLRV
jgi:hypothetical protein